MEIAIPDVHRGFAPVVGALALSLGAPGGNSAFAQDEARVAQIATMLPAEPRGVGPTIEDRVAWEAAAAHPAFADSVAQAEALLDQPIPALTDELYLDYSKTGNRRRWEAVARERHGRVPIFAIAECLENEGRFLAPLEKSLRAMCAEKTWVMPAHDRGMRNFKGETHEIDLMVAGQSWILATTLHWMEDKLSADVRALVRGELERRTFAPLEDMTITGKLSKWWLVATNNWDAVCLAGVTGTALATIEPVYRRAFFVAAAEEYIENFLRGFTSDGYCSEGLGYWNYGFSHFALLAETLHQATGGGVNLLDDERVEQIARFGRRLELTPGVYPAFADCRPDAQPDPALSAFLSRRYGFGWTDAEENGLLLDVGPSSSLFRLGLFGFANSASARPSGTSDLARPRREWFPKAGILICRAGEGDLAVALKGGHNGEHHNHNDVGSFVVARGGAAPLVDPGGEVYTRRTFSNQRYESDVLNSLGHPVPRVAGRLQSTGKTAKATVVGGWFGDIADDFALDLAAAYDVDSLVSLERRFLFHRHDGGSLHVYDRVEFSSPESFESALVTFSPWRRTEDGSLIIGEGKEAVEVTILVDGATPADLLPWELRPEELRADLSGGRTPVRLGIVVTGPVLEAGIGITVTPAPSDH